MTGLSHRKKFLLPLVSFVVVLSVLPLLWSLALAVGRIDGEAYSFTGLENFRAVIGDYRFHGSLVFTVGFAVTVTALEIALGLALAVAVHGSGGTVDRWKGLLAIPFFMAPVALGYLGLTIFHEESGPLNLILKGLHLPGVPWLSSGWGARLSLLLADLWEWTPFCFLILYAAIIAQPADLYEAARLEPLSRWNRFRYLTFPLLRPTVMLVALLRFLEALKTADLPFSLTGGGPGSSTETLSLLAYRKCMKFFDFGYGSALAWVLFILVMIAAQVMARRMLKRAAE